MPTIDAHGPHFRASVSLRRAESGSAAPRVFAFPESGRRNVPLGVAGVPGYNTVQLRSVPNSRVAAGETFFADCRLLHELAFTGRIAVGTAFVLWDGLEFADGLVEAVFTETWGNPETEHGIVACAPCTSRWPDPGPISMRVLAEAASLAEQTRSIEAIALLRRETGMSLTSAKGVINHFAVAGTQCHRCRRPVPIDSTLICIGCGSVNYSWTTPA